MATEFTTAPIISYQGQNLDFASICQALEQIGVKAGDDICVHSSLMRLGKILVTPKQLLDTLIAAFREVIGPQGTLIMPTFTYSYCHQQIYDVLHTPSTMGILTEYYRQLPQYHRTINPIFHFAVSGPNADYYLNEKATSCFGINSVYDLLTKRNGQIVVFGEKGKGYTFVHHIEEEVPVSYRYYKTFAGTMIDAQGHKRQTSIRYFVRHLNRRSVVYGIKVLNFLEQQGLSTELPLGGGTICAFACQPSKQALLQLMREDEQQLLMD